MPGLRKDSDDEEDPPAFSPVSRRGKGLGRLAITDGDGPGSADSMPDLQSVSNTDDDDGDEDDSDDDYMEDENRNGDDTDNFYDAENEDEIREMVDEAKFFAIFDAGNNIPSEIDPFLQDHKGNPFLKLLGSLRGWSQ